MNLLCFFKSPAKKAFIICFNGFGQRFEATLTTPFAPIAIIGMSWNHRRSTQ